MKPRIVPIGGKAKVAGTVSKDGLNLGTRLLPFQQGDFIAELLHGFFELPVVVEELPNEVEQRVHEGRALLGPNVARAESREVPTSCFPM